MSYKALYLNLEYRSYELIKPRYLLGKIKSGAILCLGARKHRFQT